MLSKAEPLRVLFLGDRLIARRTLGLFQCSPYNEQFALECIVSGAELLSEYAHLLVDGGRVLLNNKRHNEILVNEIRNRKIDFILSIQHNWILGEEVLEAVGGRAFNLHNAKLPDYKGYNSISHALLNGDSELVSTLHWMVPEVDSGAIIYEEITPVFPEDSAFTIYPRTVESALRAIRKLLDLLAAGADIPAHRMAEGSGHFYSRHDIEDFLDVSRVVDPSEWNRIVKSVFFPPYNVAYIAQDGSRTYLVPAEGGDSILLGAPPQNR